MQAVQMREQFDREFVGPYAPLSIAVERKLSEGAVRRADRPALRAALKAVDSQPVQWNTPDEISSHEWETARPAPDCIVERFLYADVKETVAAGGTGKTTAKLHEAICIVLKLPLYGREVLRTGPVLILTAEDPREILVARLRAVAAAMDLTPAQIDLVRQNVLISDVSGLGFKLTEVSCDVVFPSSKVDALIEGLKDVRPVLVVIDPAVSFGVGEARVNDAEQGLIEAARKLRNALNCAVEFVHHSGKQNGRDRAVDQYAGRNGSALPDGARMVAVLAPMTPDEFMAETGQELTEDETAIRMALPKLSYCPRQPDILIRRRGYHFENVQPTANGKAAARDANADMIYRLLLSELAEGRRHSRNTLEHESDLKRADLRAAVDRLEADGRIEVRAADAGGKGGRRFYLHPIASPEHFGEPNAESGK